jgi:hypothetical protein
VRERGKSTSSRNGVKCMNKVEGMSVACVCALYKFQLSCVCSSDGFHREGWCMRNGVDGSLIELLIKLF